jgi:hypothetical protein
MVSSAGDFHFLQPGSRAAGFLRAESHFSVFRRISGNGRISPRHDRKPPKFLYPIE